MTPNREKLALLCYGQSEFVKRQTHDRQGRWDAWRFHTYSELKNNGSCNYDAVVVYEALPHRLDIHCDPSRLIFVTGEPESVRPYDSRFLSQFSAVITSRADVVHPNVIPSQPAIPWWVGIECVYPNKNRVNLDYDHFSALQAMDLPKPKLLSIICSSKRATVGHRKRLKFLDHLKKHFKTRLDVYGDGISAVADKWDAIAPYKYSVVIENSSFPNYWSEKLADVYLGGSFPFYWGCPNLDEYFPNDSFAMVDRDDCEAAISIIESTISSGVYEARTEILREARELILHRYNLFPTLARIFESQHSDGTKLVRLRPESAFTGGLRKRARKALRSTLERASWAPKRS